MSVCVLGERHMHHNGLQSASMCIRGRQKAVGSEHPKAYKLYLSLPGMQYSSEDWQHICAFRSCVVGFCSVVQLMVCSFCVPEGPALLPGRYLSVKMLLKKSIWPKTRVTFLHRYIQMHQQQHQIKQNEQRGRFDVDTA